MRSATLLGAVPAVLDPPTAAERRQMSRVGRRRAVRPATRGGGRRRGAAGCSATRRNGVHDRSPSVRQADAPPRSSVAGERAICPPLIALHGQGGRCVCAPAIGDPANQALRRGWLQPCRSPRLEPSPPHGAQRRRAPGRVAKIGPAEIRRTPRSLTGRCFGRAHDDARPPRPPARGAESGRLSTGRPRARRRRIAPVRLDGRARGRSSRRARLLRPPMDSLCPRVRCVQTAPPAAASSRPRPPPPPPLSSPRCVRRRQTLAPSGSPLPCPGPEPVSPEGGGARAPKLNLHPSCVVSRMSSDKSDAMR